MADEAAAAPAEGATTAEAPKAEAAAQAALPEAIQAVMQKYGLTKPDDVAAMAEAYAFAGTPEGAKLVVDNVAAKHGVQIAKKVMATKPDEVLKDADREVRRKVRRAVARHDQNNDSTVTEGDDIDDAPNPAEEARASAKEALEAARRAEAKSDTAARATGLAPLLLAEARKDERIANNFSDWMTEVTNLVETGHPKYQGGAAGVKAASEDVLRAWARYGQMAGMAVPSAPAAKPTAETIAVKPEDVSKSVKEARERTRGMSSSSFVDDIIAREFPV